MTARWIVFVSDRNQLKQLECEPESVLSMEEALHEVRPPSLVQHLYGNMGTLLKHNSLHSRSPSWAIFKYHLSTRDLRVRHFASWLVC